ncbi:endolytic transglycosylase MltG [Thalassolituus sp. UBA6592]|uniref:endolytic transglycosylase MltG n=2 Tax=unclassified Thalassolituus TaxID=2624967 RepID=UPI0025CD9FD3|nr:endolytic transglycosylase MltG [Thalassolituus sp. UBA6592]
MKKLLRLGAGLIFLVAVLAIAVWFVPANNQDPVRVTIHQGDTLSGLSRQWQADGWLPSSLLLRVQSRLLGMDHALRTGEYDVPPGLNGMELLQFLASAQPVTYRLSLIEGLTLSEALPAIAQAPQLQQDIEPLNPAAVASLLGIEGNPEGWLYPDTYVYRSGDKASTIVRQAYERMQRQLQAAWAGRSEGLPYDKPYDALIMASIVEKETGVVSERPIIAGVFVRRLNMNMRLETDPTVIYGLGPEFDGNLRKRHLQDRTNPYNTYRQKGLPPTPIALAGRAALDAALNPSDGDQLFFVARGDGSHYFSATLEEHNKAVRKYQIFRRKEDYRSAPPAESSGDDSEPKQQESSQ